MTNPSMVAKLNYVFHFHFEEYVCSHDPPRILGLSSLKALEVHLSTICLVLRMPIQFISLISNILLSLQHTDLAYKIAIRIV